MAVNTTQVEHSWHPGSAMAAEALADIPFTRTGEIVVEVELASAPGERSVLTEGADYTVAVPGGASWGSVTALAEWAADDWFHARRVTERTQEEQFTPFQLKAEAVGAAADKAMRIDQEQDVEIERAPRVRRGQAAPALDMAGLLDGELLRYDAVAGALVRFDHASFAGKFFFGGPTGLMVPVAGVPSGDVSLADLADDAAGANLMGWSGRTQAQKNAERRDLLDTPGAATAVNVAVAALVAANPDGFELHLPPQAVAATGTILFDNERPAMIGKGPNVSTIEANYPGDLPIIDIESGTPGGIYQGLLADFGISSNVVANKTAIRLHNVANWEVRGIGIPQGALLGDSIGLDLSLRQPCSIGDSRMSIACAQPVVFSPNAEWPSLCADHSTLQCAELIGTSASFPVVNFKPGCVLSNTTITGALVGGKQGIKAVNKTVLANSSNLTICYGRHEQSLDPDAFGIDLDFDSASPSTILRSLLVFNYATDYFQHGTKLRGVKHAHFDTVELNQGTGLTALDVEMIPGGSLTLDSCVGQVGGTIVVTNGHLVSFTPSSEANNPIGSRMHWAYFETPLDPGEGGTYDYELLPTTTQGNILTASFRFEYPTGTRYLRLPLCQPAGMAISADVVVRSENDRMFLTFKKDGTFTVHSASGIFAAAATAGKIYPVATGQLLANALAAPAAISVEIRQ